MSLRRRLGSWLLFNPRGVVTCPACIAQTSEIIFLRGQVQELQRQVIALSAGTGTMKSLEAAKDGAPQPIPRERVTRLTPWAQGLAAGGHINMHEIRKKAGEFRTLASMIGPSESVPTWDPTGNPDQDPEESV